MAERNIPVRRLNMISGQRFFYVLSRPTEGGWPESFGGGIRDRKVPKAIGDREVRNTACRKPSRATEVARPLEIDGVAP